MKRFLVTALLIALCYCTAFAQQPVKRIPPEGIQITDNDRDELVLGLLKLGKAIDGLQQQNDGFINQMLPDVQIYYKAVDYALKYDEFFSPKDVLSAKKLLQDGLSRATFLKNKIAPWTTQRGEVVRGYISKIDGSVQPYALTIPDNYNANGPAFNLSFWFHGRNETLSEINFISNNKSFIGPMPLMKNTIMLYPYGRYCNAFKFAGEVDVLEALEDAEKNYHINDNALFDRGFSMGGAATWHFAVHFPDVWIAANPGAGFAETYDFMRVYGHEELHPTWYERKLWHLYDCTDYASNLANLPLFVYNGDKDPQKQAGDVMEVAMKKEGLEMNRTWGKNIGHAYTKEGAATIDSLLAQVQKKGKNHPPAELHFTTYTLKYNQLYWIRFDALGEHWNKARVDGVINGNTINLNTTNVTALTVLPQQLLEWVKPNREITINIDNTVIKINSISNVDNLSFHQVNGQWGLGYPGSELAKRRNLQGPVDDAFMSAFIVVKPTGASKNMLFDKWSKAEMERFIIQWRAQFRGDPIVKNDTEITPDDMAANLILFGDAQSNKVIAKVNNQLPVKWTPTEIKAGNSTYPAKDHGLIMIYPNPLNQKRYIVLNSGFTFREQSYLNNSKQIPMLPDWAVVDLNTPPDAVHPGKIANAGFFGEKWEWKAPVKD